MTGRKSITEVEFGHLRYKLGASGGSVIFSVLDSSPPFLPQRLLTSRIWALLLTLQSDPVGLSKDCLQLRAACCCEKGAYQELGDLHFSSDLTFY